MSALPQRHRTATVVRRATEILARCDSTDALPHHLVYLEQLRNAQPPTNVRVELRALWQHLWVATGAPQATPWPIVFAASLISLSLLMVPVLPEPSFEYIDPIGSLIAQALHFAGFLGIAAALVSLPPTSRRRFVRWGLVPTMGAQLLYVFVHLPETDPVVAAADDVLRVAEVLGLLTSVLILVGMLGHRRIFITGWFGLSLSMLVLACSQTIYAVAFARHGDTMWVISLGLPAVAVPLLAYGMFRYVPRWWTRDAPMIG